METNLIDEAHRIEAAAHAYADKLPRLLPVVQLKPCPRCSGKGYGFFMGSDGAPGECYRCDSRNPGQIPATRAGARALKLAQAQLMVERLRVIYRGQVLALSFARAALAEGERGARFTVETFERYIDNTLTQGKHWAAEAARWEGGK